MPHQPRLRGESNVSWGRSKGARRGHKKLGWSHLHTFDSLHLLLSAHKYKNYWCGEDPQAKILSATKRVLLVTETIAHVQKYHCMLHQFPHIRQPYAGWFSNRTNDMAIVSNVNINNSKRSITMATTIELFRQSCSSALDSWRFWVWNKMSLICVSKWFRFGRSSLSLVCVHQVVLCVIPLKSQNSARKHLFPCGKCFLCL